MTIRIRHYPKAGISDDVGSTQPVVDGVSRVLRGGAFGIDRCSSARPTVTATYRRAVSTPTDSVRSELYHLIPLTPLPNSSPQASNSIFGFAALMAVEKSRFGFMGLSDRSVARTMAKAEELVVITKTYDLILWSCQHTSRFPRQHRFVLGERIERNLYDLLETLIQAKYTRERITLLEQANLKLEILRFQVRLAKDLQCLRINSYEFASQSDEIGRLVGGWLRPRKSQS